MIIWLAVAAVALVAMFVWWANAQARGLNDYFRGAVEMFALIGDPEARLAALTVAKVAAGQQRASMRHYLRGMASDVARVPAPPGVDSASIRERLLKLEREIGVKDWTTADATAAKRELAARAPQYLSALERADATVFRVGQP